MATIYSARCVRCGHQHHLVGKPIRDGEHLEHAVMHTNIHSLIPDKAELRKWEKQLRQDAGDAARLREVNAALLAACVAALELVASSGDEDAYTEAVADQLRDAIAAAKQE